VTPRRYNLDKRAAAADQTRQRILDATEQVGREGGLAAVTVDRVAEEAGVTRATIYRHFGSRGGLFEALSWDRVSRAQLDLMDAARQQPDLTKALRDFLRENCRLFARIGPALQTLLELARHDADVARVIDTGYYGRRIQSLEALASRLQREGRLRQGWTRARAVDALIVLASLEPFQALSRRGHTPDRVADVLFELAGGMLAT
jgi:AcrR family transcriptional regulator